MGKTYYCDYCDRTFKDDYDARKKHLSSLQHAKNRADHYAIYKDAETILKEESVKIQCKRYMTVGDCAFGSSCRFSHYTPSMMWELHKLVMMKHYKEFLPEPKNGWPNPDDIIKEYFENTMIDLSSTDETNYPVWSTSSRLVDYSYLPPSLQPVTPEKMMDSNFSKWGS